MDFISTREAGDRLGLQSCSIWRLCRRNPGFGLQVGSHFRIPSAHIQRVLDGESVKSISSSPSWRDGERDAA